jgi:hypothetical protein
MWRRGLYDVIDVRTIDQVGETITPKVHGPDGDVMERTNLANQSSHTKDSCRFAAVRASIRKGAPSTMFTPVRWLTLDSALVGYPLPNTDGHTIRLQ